MKRLAIGKVGVVVASLFLLVMPAIIHAQPEQAKPGSPPVEQQLVREGSFAVKLATALGLSSTQDEAEAESRLGEAGITPRNGWIADYPVTPDIVGELQKAVGVAADAKKIPIAKDEAQKRFDNVNAEFSLSIRPTTTVKTYETAPAEAENYPTPTEINNYYYEEGPPVVTYYAPPPDYYYLYAWVPNPFWWYGFWFPGFFILNDFHRTAFVDNRVVFISNHFNDFRAHRVFRIDPVARFRGRTFAGIGVSNRRGFISTGVQRSERAIFNESRMRMAPSYRTNIPTSRGGRISTPTSRSGGRMVAPPSRSGGARMAAPRSQGGGRMVAPPSRGGGGGMERGQKK
jgi:hypothetical protein